MPRLQRTRTVVFRVTQSEYDQLKDACSGSGARNLSDYTRTELLSHIQADAQGMTVPERFNEIDRKLGELSQAVSRISEIVSNGGPSMVARASKGA
jgi:hypothetical protein